MKTKPEIFEKVEMILDEIRMNKKVNELCNEIAKTIYNSLPEVFDDNVVPTDRIEIVGNCICEIIKAILFTEYTRIGREVNKAVEEKETTITIPSSSSKLN